MNKSIIILLLSLSFINCTKDSIEVDAIQPAHNHEHDTTPEPTTQALPNIADVYETAPQYVIDEAIAEAEYMGLSIVLDYLNDVDIYMRDVDGGAFYSAQDGTVLGTSQNFASERPYIVLDVNNRQEGFVLVHEMLHHYRQVVMPSLHNQFGWLTIHIDANGNHSQEIHIGEFSSDMDTTWSVVETFEYATQIVALANARGETSVDGMGQNVFDFVVNHFNL